jgi:hypothetical protein
VGEAMYVRSPWSVGPMTSGENRKMWSARVAHPFALSWPMYRSSLSSRTRLVPWPRSVSICGKRFLHPPTSEASRTPASRAG